MARFLELEALPYVALDLDPERIAKAQQRLAAPAPVRYPAPKRLSLPPALGSPMGNGRVDGVLGDIAFDAQIIVMGGITFEAVALGFHFVCCLPGTGYHLAHAPHSLGVRENTRTWDR